MSVSFCQTKHGRPFLVAQPDSRISDNRASSFKRCELVFPTTISVVFISPSKYGTLPKFRRSRLKINAENYVVVAEDAVAVEEVEAAVGVANAIP